jgi:hypothetical protein
MCTFASTRSKAPHTATYTDRHANMLTHAFAHGHAWTHVHLAPVQPSVGKHTRTACTGAMHKAHPAAHEFWNPEFVNLVLRTQNFLHLTFSSPHAPQSLLQPSLPAWNILVKWLLVTLQ